MTIADRKEREREERRMQIISAAENLFFKNGYDSVSIDQIARDAELSKGTIFFYFKNKEALFLTILCQGFRLFHRLIDDAIDQCDDSPARQLYALGRIGIRFSHEYPGYRSMISQVKSGRFSLEDRDNGDPEVAEIISHTDDITEYVESIVRRGIDDGSIKDTLDPGELAIIFKMMIGCIMDESPELEWSLRKHDINRDILISHYLDQVILLFCGSEQLQKIHSTEKNR